MVFKTLLLWDSLERTGFLNSTVGGEILEKSLMFTVSISEHRAS